MTREEAIRKLEDTLEYRDRYCNEHDIERNALTDALDMAIAALREQEDPKAVLVEHYIKVPEKPKWISVEERLPDAEQEVRVLCKASWNSCYRYQCQAFYEPKGMLREKSNYGWDYECCSEYSEEDDDYFANPGWYERIHNWDDYSAVGIADEVTHWMPLPEAPLEEE